MQPPARGLHPFDALDGVRPSALGVLVAGPPADALVAAGAEGPAAVLRARAVPGEQHEADVGRIAGVVEDAVELVDGVRAERVADLGPVEGDPHRAAGRPERAAVVGDVGEVRSPAPRATRRGRTSRHPAPCTSPHAARIGPPADAPASRASRTALRGPDPASTSCSAARVVRLPLRSAFVGSSSGRRSCCTVRTGGASSRRSWSTGTTRPPGGSPRRSRRPGGAGRRPVAIRTGQRDGAGRRRPTRWPTCWRASPAARRPRSRWPSGSGPRRRRRTGRRGPRVLGAAGRIRVDANGAWRVEDAAHALGRLAGTTSSTPSSPARRSTELRALRVALARRGRGRAGRRRRGVRKADDPLRVP